ncbi:MAG: arylesterase [Burkholderiales bacterium]|jgi:lysophospholipase L1-like esterase
MRVARLALLACVLALAACAKSPQLARLGPDDVVLAFGDSLTYGTGASEQESYPAQLGRMTGRRVVQSGVPGEVTSQALARLPGVLDEYSPRLLLLCTGGNDFLRRLGKLQAAANVRAMVRLAKGRNIDVVLIGPPEPGLTLSPPSFYDDIATEFHIPYEGDVIGEVLRKPELKSDPIHPNASGYRIVAERLTELLRKSGAL